MPLIRYIYPPDIAAHGADPIAVLDVEARTLVADRRAVLVPAESLASATKADLVEQAAAMGVSVDPKDRKDKIVDAIVAQQSEVPPIPQAPQGS